MLSKNSPVVGGILLVAGTSIGAGMLALPVVTASGGFAPAFFTYLFCWFFMTCTGILLLELCLKLPPDANLVTMATTYLGPFGKFFAWALYLFLFYCLSTAYVSGGGALLQSWLGGSAAWTTQLLFVALTAPFVVAGTQSVDRLNFFLMIGLIGSYIIFVFLGAPSVEMAGLQTASWSASWAALPIVFTSFSFQGVVPSLTTYLKRDAKKVRIAIIGGTSIAFFIYLLWEFLILGIVPIEGLQEAHRLGQTAVAPLKHHVSSSLVSHVGQIFAFFAIATSFLGVTMGLLDFLADSLKMAKKGKRKLFLSLLTFSPPSIIALTNPHIFLTALQFAGGIGCALLLGFLPILMTWISRYGNADPRTGPVQLAGGRGMLFFLFLFLFLELAIEISPFFF